MLASLCAAAQRDCVSQSYIEQQQSADPMLAGRLSAVESFIQHQQTNMRITGSGAASVIQIPVVVHVVYKTNADNISDEQIISQIQALNRDFRRDNFDTVNTPERFRSVAADVQIEFVLATADPMGRKTNGIVRKQTTVDSWSNNDNIKFASTGGDNAWDSRFFLNIWVGNLQSVICYYSSPGCDSAKDGLVIASSAFGTIAKTGVYNMGRTVVHEAGHWLGLKHIWGDYYCGDDLVDDTPKQGNFTPGCPSGFRSSCSNGTTGDMYMNYMDYTSDACLNMFTIGQKQRMRSLFAAGGPRASILASKGLQAPWTQEAPLPVVEVAPVKRFYPNPFTNEILLHLSADWVGKHVRVMNVNGTTLLTLTITSAEQKINLSSLRKGIYFLQGSSGEERFSEKLVKL
jgi:hypothetical protein